MEDIQEQLIIDYDGQNIKKHQMDINDFIVSINGCYNLLKIIAEELNIPEAHVKITIGPLEKGSVKANIFFGIFGYVLANFFDGAGVNNVINQWGQEFVTFLKTKRDNVLNYDTLPQLAIEADDIQGRLLQRKDTHQALNNIVRCLNTDAEKITINIPSQRATEKITKENLQNITVNPFSEDLEFQEEIAEDVIMTLYLESVGITSTQWIFYEKISSKRNRRIIADVLDNNLLVNARNSALEKEYKNIPLKCRVKVITHKKGKHLSYSYYILECHKDVTLSLFE